MPVKAKGSFRRSFMAWRASLPPCACYRNGQPDRESVDNLKVFGISRPDLTIAFVQFCQREHVRPDAGVNHAIAQTSGL